MKVFYVAAALLCVSLLTACGKKGDLTLPEQSAADSTAVVVGQ